MAKQTTKSEKAMRTDLLDQLSAQGKTASYYVDLVDRYLFLRRTADALQKDIDERGPVVPITSGNGFTKTAPNESIRELKNTLSLMLVIIRDLNLREPAAAEDDDAAYLQ